MDSILRSFAALIHTFDAAATARKLDCIGKLARKNLRSADDVLALHEALCFLRAYPDSPAVLTAVERELARFERRADLRRFAEDLRDSGIAGTPIQYSFFHQMATWLAARYPRHLHILWDQLRKPELLEDRLPVLSLFAETVGLDELVIEPRDWIDRMRGADTDATYLIRRCTAQGLTGGLAEKLYEDLDIEIEIAPLPKGPSRTHAKDPGATVHWQTGPMRSGRPDLRDAALLEPLAIREVSREDGQRFIDMAREAMVTRSRDLDAFAYGDPDDVRLIEWEDGLQFASIGVIPERRLMLEAVYGYLTLKNGVPIGYVLNSALFGSADIAYNVFETWRGAEAAWIYARVVATVRGMFGVDSFTVYPYQLGDHNTEGLESGAWWFYQKLGYRPKDPATRRLMAVELARMKKKPKHRSSIATLRKLARKNVFFHLGADRDDVIGLLPNPYVGLAITTALSRRFASAREEGEAQCAHEAAELCGVTSLAGWTAGERLAWNRWAPLVTILPGVKRWSESDRRALGEVVRKKGGRREQDFVRAFDAHARLRAAILTIGHREESRLD